MPHHCCVRPPRTGSPSLTGGDYFSMADEHLGVIGGVDCHLDTHHAVALDTHGRKLGDCEFRVSQAGYSTLLQWLQQFGLIVAVGVESTASYGAGLTRFLTTAGVNVVEVNQPHRHLRYRRGKSDAIDAEAAARKVLSGEATAVPKDTTGIVESIRQLRLVRASAVKARSAALTQLGELIATAPSEVREALTRKTLRGQASICSRLRPSLDRLSEPIQAAKLARRTLGQRIITLDNEIAALDKHLDKLVASAAPRTTALLGISTGHAAQLLITAGQNIERLRSEAAFAHLCGAAPVPASSGKTTRHRLNWGGDRQANAALHLIAVVRLRYCERTRAYAARRTLEGRSKREILRCLKRYVARQVFHSLQADLAALGTT
jgi:transposase